MRAFWCRFRADATFANGVLWSVFLASMLLVGVALIVDWIL